MTKSREVRGFEVVVTATALRNQKRKLGTIWSKAFQVLQLQYQAGIWSIFDFAVAAQNDENDHEIWRELMMKWEIGAVQVYVCFLLIFRTSLRTTLSRKLVVRPAGQNHFPLFTWGSSRTERRSSQIDSLVTNFRCWTTQTPFYLLWHRLIFSRSRFSSSSQLKWFLSLFGGHFQVDASSSRHNRKTVVNGFSNTLLLHFFDLSTSAKPPATNFIQNQQKRNPHWIDKKEEEPIYLWWSSCSQKSVAFEKWYDLLSRALKRPSNPFCIRDLILMILNFWSEESSQWKVM